MIAWWTSRKVRRKDLRQARNWRKYRHLGRMYEARIERVIYRDGGK